jgi:hypothetical protein
MERGSHTPAAQGDTTRRLRRPFIIDRHVAAAERASVVATGVVNPFALLRASDAP